MKINIHILVSILLCALLTLSGCGAQDVTAQTDPAAGTDTPEESPSAGTDAASVSSIFSDRDLAGSYDEAEAVAIMLEGESASCSSDAVSVDGGQIVIGAEGVYVVSGTLDDGQIIVNAGETDKVQLVLKGADITCGSSAAIYALEADKVFITLAEGTENRLANGGEYIAIDDNNIDAVIFAKTDLTLNGSGSLSIDAQAGHGVVSKDDLVIVGGSYTIAAASHGLSGKDSVAIASGNFVISSGKDGIHSENSDDLTLGTLYIASGSFDIASQGDAVSAQGELQIDGGDFELYTGEGSAGVEMSTGDDFGGMGGPFGWTDTGAQTQDDEDSVSQKGIKGESAFTISGGTLDLTCNGNGDTAIDCDGSYANNAERSVPTMARRTTLVRWVLDSAETWAARHLPGLATGENPAVRLSVLRNVFVRRRNCLVCAWGMCHEQTCPPDKCAKKRSTGRWNNICATPPERTGRNKETYVCITYSVPGHKTVAGDELSILPYP